MINNEVIRIFVQIEVIKKIPNVSEAVLKEYARIATELNKNLKLTPLSFVIHDIQMLLHIEKKALAEITKVYEEQEKLGKQIFIAFDWLDIYDRETQKIAEEHYVLRFSPDGNELFARAWNEEMESEDGGEES